MRHLHAKFGDDVTDRALLIASGVKQNIDCGDFSAKIQFFWHPQKTSQNLAFLKNVRVSLCDQAQSSQVWCNSGKGFQICIFQKNVPLAIHFSLSLNYIILTPGKICDHKKLCSMKVKVHQKLPRFLLDYLVFHTKQFWKWSKSAKTW